MRTVPLTEVAEINPRRHSIAAEDPVSFVGMAELSAETAVAQPRETLPFEQVSKGYTIFRDHDILAAKITPCWENGKVGQARLNHEIGVGSTEFHVVRAQEAADARYLMHFLRTPRVRANGELRMTGSGGQRRVPTNYLGSLEVPLPPIEEQRRIAAVLDQAHALCAKRRQVLAHLDDLTQSIFHDMFGDPVSNSLGVPVVPLEEWVQDGRPITYGILKPGPEVSNGVPYVRVADMKDGGIRTAGVRCTSSEIAVAYRRSALQAGDLLMSIRGHVGRFAHVPDELSGGNITQDSARLSISDRATSTYVRAVMESPAIQHWMVRHTKGVAVRGLNIGDLRKVPIPQVALADRQTFAGKVQSVGRQREIARAALTNENELFASLQSRAFRGEL